MHCIYGCGHLKTVAAAINVVLEREPVTGRRPEEDLACGISWKASHASDIETEIERDESENNEGKNFPQRAQEERIW